MMSNLTADNALAIRTVSYAVERVEIPLIALNHITSEDSLKYYKDLDKEDIPHNLDNFFTELRTIYDLIRGEMEELREYKFDLEAKGKRNVQ